jgi:hypothetical protein
MESFFEGYKYTFSALGAVGTLLAVIISLYFGYRALKTQQTQIKASISIKALSTPEMPQYIIVEIINVGLMPISIPYWFLTFKIPFSSNVLFIKPFDGNFNGNLNITQKCYPYIVAPKHSEIFFISEVDSFFKKVNQSEKNINPWHLKFIKARIHASDGSIFDIKVPDNIKKIIKENSTHQIKEKRNAT